MHAGVKLGTAAEAQATLPDDGEVLLREARHDAVVDGRRLRRFVHLLVRRARPPVPTPEQALQDSTYAESLLLRVSCCQI